MNRILFVDDDIVFSKMLQGWLKKKGYSVDVASTIVEGENLFRKETYDLVIVDLRLPDGMGLDLLTSIKEVSSNIPVIMLTGYADINSAVKSMQLGAVDYLTKPIQPEELLNKIKEFDKSAPKKEKPRENVSYIEGVDEKSQRLYHHLSLVAPTNMSVLIRGESGTGKEYIAHKIHQLSSRSSAPFVAVDCGSIPKDLAASEFFGHIKGSFTGAIQDKTGLIEEADGGTLFLDEVGNLSYEIQMLLLRALQERKIKPVGGTVDKSVDIRVITATNENLEDAVARGDFREDLFHRLNEFTLNIPPLRERSADIPLFLDHFLSQANKELGRDVKGFTPEVLELLKSYKWTGNLREMKNLVKRSCLLTIGDYIEMSALADDFIQQVEVQAQQDSPFIDNERERIIAALKETKNNKSKAAQLLRIDRKTLYNKLSHYDIKNEELEG